MITASAIGKIARIIYDNQQEENNCLILVLQCQKSHTTDVDKGNGAVHDFINIHAYGSAAELIRQFHTEETTFYFPYLLYREDIADLNPIQKHVYFIAETAVITPATQKL